MTGFEKVVLWFSGTMKVQPVLGWLHWLLLLLTAALAVGAGFLGPRLSRRGVRFVIGFVGLGMCLLEAWRQVILSFHYNGGDPYWSYNWTLFPYQFCNMNYYLMPLAAILPDGKVRDSIECVLATYLVFGGLSVVIYPGQIFGAGIYNSLWTYCLHVLMVATGVLLYASGEVKPVTASVLKALPAFLVMVASAIVLNEVVWAAGIRTLFSMYFISSHFASSVPVLNLVQTVVPYPFFVFLYAIGYTGFAFLIQNLARWIGMAISALRRRRSARR